MAATANPMPAIAAPPPVSKRTVHMAGLLVDIFGIAELPDDVESLSLLWLHHPRLGKREIMADTAAVCLDAWRQSPAATHSKRGLVGLSFDQRNHGTRLVSDIANKAWREGNPTHALDMFSHVTGTVSDQRQLLDVVGAYLHRELTAAGKQPEGGLVIPIAQHLLLGVSLGGHVGWHLLFSDPRVTAAAIIVGCPDYQALMVDRARLTKLATYKAFAAGGPPFLGSPDFPADLVATIEKFDPRGVIFGSSREASWPTTARELAQLHDTLQARVSGKKIFLCSGGADKLVPYRFTEAVTSVLRRATHTWPDLDLAIEDKVYAGVGHNFTLDMVTETVEFIVNTVIEDVAKGQSKANL